MVVSVVVVVVVVDAVIVVAVGGIGDKKMKVDIHWKCNLVI